MWTLLGFLLVALGAFLIGRWTRKDERSELHVEYGVEYHDGDLPDGPVSLREADALVACSHRNGGNAELVSRVTSDWQTALLARRPRRGLYLEQDAP